MIFIYKFVADAYVYNRLMDPLLVEVLLEFIDERNFELKGEFFECHMTEDEVKGLLNLLDQESYYYTQDAKLNNYDFGVAKSYTKRMNAVDELQLSIEELLIAGEALDYFRIAIEKEHSAFQSSVDIKRTEAVESLLLLEEYYALIPYPHNIDLADSIEKDYFDDLTTNWAWGIGYVSKEDSLLSGKYIPLKGFQVSVTTEIKKYFTNVYEVIYTAFHIYRNPRDHRYQYKQKRAQRNYRFIVNKNDAVEVNSANEQEYVQLVEEANTLQSLFNKQAEKSLRNLFELNKAIITPFNKNNRYYQKITELINAFVENDYLTIIQTYFLLGHINKAEYNYHFDLIEELKKRIEKIEYLQVTFGKEEVILTKQAFLLKFFIASSDIAPKAGILEISGPIVQRTLMQIEKERGYAEEYRSDDSLKEFYIQQLH